MEASEQLAELALERLLALQAERPTKGERDEQHRQHELAHALREARDEVEGEDRVPPAQALAVLSVPPEVEELADGC